MITPKPGTISWMDLTIPNADAVRDFYAAVAGWKAEPVDMEGYHDYCMFPPGGDVPAAGICHARGPNANLPPQWLIYITVPDLDRSLASCLAAGGAVVAPVREMGGGRMAVIRESKSTCTAAM
ncbi:MAG: VOC family protein [Verrucomicrobia bacterium]|nr:VOC family protein [Verrucomicrobiota bacterium]